MGNTCCTPQADHHNLDMNQPQAIEEYYETQEGVGNNLKPDANPQREKISSNLVSGVPESYNEDEKLKSEVVEGITPEKPRMSDCISSQQYQSARALNQISD